MTDENFEAMEKEHNDENPLIRGKVCLGKCKTTRGYHFRFMENLNVH